MGNNPQLTHWPSRPLPPLVRVEQRFSSEHEETPRLTTKQKLLAAGLAKAIQPDSKIAITAGSRGFGGFPEIAAGIVDAIQSVGAKAILVPAMGSHGSATAEGQTELLHRIGINETSVPAPIHATMDTFALGTTKNGATAHIDRVAAQCDGIIVLGRVKTHPERNEGIASGLLKMVAVGLGKQIGAQEAHSHGLWESVESVPEKTMAQSKILFGVAVVENAYRQPTLIEIVPGTYSAFREADQRLLKIALDHASTIPFPQLDLLIVDEIGKTISGTGMDLNVIGKWRLSGGPRRPDFFRIVALSLTQGSLGNGLGIGLADFTTKRFVRDFDPVATYINLLTASEPGVMNTREGVLPLALANDREAIEVGLHSSLAGAQPRICRIRNTGHLSELWVSDALLQEVETHPKLFVADESQPLPFDATGNLIQ